MLRAKFDTDTIRFSDEVLDQYLPGLALSALRGAVLPMPAAEQAETHTEGVTTLPAGTARRVEAGEYAAARAEAH